MAMTTPVTTLHKDGKRVMAFMQPRDLLDSNENLNPTDSRVNLIREPERIVYARFDTFITRNLRA